MRGAEAPLLTVGLCLHLPPRDLAPQLIVQVQYLLLILLGEPEAWSLGTGRISGRGCGGGGGLGDWTEAWTFFAEISITFGSVRTRSASRTGRERVAVRVNFAIGYKFASVSTDN